MEQAINVEVLKRYNMAREDAGHFMDRIHSLAQVVAAAARSPDAQSGVNVEAVGVVSEVIIEDVRKIEAIFDRYHDTLRAAEGK